MKLKITFCAFLFCCMSHAQAQNTAQSLVNHINQMFVAKSADTLKSQLSSDFSVAAYTMPSAFNLLKTIAKRYACDSLQLKASNKQGDGFKLTVVPFSKGKAGKPGFLFTNSTYQILYADIFDQLYGMNRYKPALLRVKIPFEEENGSIILNVKVNGHAKPLRLLFDTGADGMAITKTLADEVGIKATRQQNTSVVGGNMQISVSEGNTIQLDTFVIKNQSFAIFPEMHKDADGIIGNSIAKNYITKVDFDKKELSLYDFGVYEYQDKGISVPVTVPSGVFIIPGDVTITPEQTHTGNFVFDTGAGYNLICFRPFVKKNKLLVSGFKPEYNGSTTSMGMSTPTYSGRASAFSFAKMPLLSNFPITLMAGGGQSENWNPGFDGSIGIRTISRYNFTINLQEKEIHFVPNKTFNYPNDFALGGYLFGFGQDGKLRVLGLIAGGENATLKAGQLITSINGITASALINNTKKMEEVLNSAKGTLFKVVSSDNGTTQTNTITK